MNQLPGDKDQLAWLAARREPQLIEVSRAEQPAKRHLLVARYVLRRNGRGC